MLQALRKDNVKVVLIHPGPVATSMTKVCDCNPHTPPPLLANICYCLFTSGAMQ